MTHKTGRLGYIGIDEEHETTPRVAVSPQLFIPLAEEKTFTCDSCGETFSMIWSDEEASMEFEQRFEGGDISTAAVVCDDCYKEMMGDKS